MVQPLSHEQLSAIAAEYGTPVYIYHAEKIKEQYQNLLQAFEGAPVRFFYAAKALTNINILRYVKSTGCNADCSSVNEARLALHAGFAPENVLYTSNNVAFSEICAARDLGIHINIDSLSNLRKFGEKFGHTYPAGIRLRPNIMAGGNLKISTGHADSKFGIPLEQLPELLEIVRETNLHIRTLHIHTGSEIKDVDVFMKGLDVLFELVPHFPELEVIDLGGGFKVPYMPGEKGTDIPLLGRRIREAFAQFTAQTGKQLEVWFEPGKYIVSECGYLVSQVNVLKPTATTVFAGVDTGLNHLIRPMFYGAYHAIQNISNPAGPEMPYTVVGNICETDTFAENRMLHEIREGDYLVMLNAGAYGFEMASHYNARFRPAEVLFKDGKAQLIRRRDELEDLLRGQVEE